MERQKKAPQRFKSSFPGRVVRRKRTGCAEEDSWRGGFNWLVFADFHKSSRGIKQRDDVRAL